MGHPLKQNIRAFALALAILLLTLATTVLAANSTTQIKVIGTIAPGVCAVNVENNGLFSYGNISAATLSPTQANSLGTKTNNLQITCGKGTRVAIYSKDEVHDSVDDSDGVRQVLNNTGANWLLGLGFAPDETTKLGAYLLILKKAGMTIDGSSHVGFLEGTNMGTGSWLSKLDRDQKLYSSTVFPGWVTSWGATGQKTPLAAQNVLIPVEVTAAIKPLDKLPKGQKSCT